MPRLEKGAARGQAAIAALAAALLAIGLCTQAVFLVRAGHHELSTPVNHRLRDFLLEADRVMVPDAPFAATTYHTSDAARYLMYPRKRVQVTVYTRRALRAAGVRYVIVSPRHRPAALTGTHSWYRVVLATPQGRVLDVAQ